MIIQSTDLEPNSDQTDTIFSYVNNENPSEIKHSFDSSYLDSINRIILKTTGSKTVKASPNFIGDSIFTPGLLHIDQSVIVFEKPPTNKTLFFKPLLVSSIENEKDHEQIYNIPIPWQVYVVSYNYYENEGETQYYIENVYMYFRNSFVNDFSDTVYSPSLPNFYANGMLCRPMISDMEELRVTPNNAQGVMQTAYNWIWNSGTNLDLTESMVLYNLYSESFTEEEKNLIYRPLYSSSTNYITSYYSPSGSVLKLFRNWENKTIENITDCDWPNPLTSDYREYMAQYTKLHPFNSFDSQYVVQETMDYDTECCEDCQNSYDVASSEIYESEYSCEDCSCHRSAVMNYTKYFHDTGFFDNTISLQDVIQQIKLNRVDSVNISFSQVISSIEESIRLNA